MRDVEYYVHHYEEPVFLFTPDSEFPLCNGEKGSLVGNITSRKFENGVILDFQGGMAHNAVPDAAYAVVRGDIAKFPPEERITVYPDTRGVRIEGVGIGGHASHAEGTINGHRSHCRLSAEIQSGDGGRGTVSDHGFQVMRGLSGTWIGN